MPVGPEFAAPDQFRPLGIGKDHDLIYVAAAQQYKSSIFYSTHWSVCRATFGYCVFLDMARWRTTCDGARQSQD